MKNANETVSVERPKVVTLCGSTRFIDEYNHWRKRLTLEGAIVLSIELVTHQRPDEDPQHVAPDVKEMLDELHLRKIDLSDEILVLNVGGYIGESTRREIEYATTTGKLVQYLEPLAPTPPADAWEDLAKTLWVEGTNDRDATAAKMRAVHESETKALREARNSLWFDLKNERVLRQNARDERDRLRSRLAALDAGEIAGAVIAAIFERGVAPWNRDHATAAVQKILDSKGEEGEAEGNDGAVSAETAPPSPTSSGVAICSYCGHEFPFGKNAAEHAVRHMSECDAHPLGEALRERDEAREQVAELKESMTAAAAQLGWDADDMEERNVPGVPESADIGYQLNVCASRVADESHKLRADLERVTRERDEILREARCWASEAKTQRGTVREVGSALGGMADWRDIAGAVRDKLATIAKLRATPSLGLVEAVIAAKIVLTTDADEARRRVHIDYYRKLIDGVLSVDIPTERRRAEAVERVVEAAKLRVRGKEEGKATLAKEGDDDLVRAVRNLRQIRGES